MHIRCLKNAALQTACATPHGLLMPNILWRSLPIKGHDLQLPLNRNRSRQKANLAVAGLILKFPRNRDGFSVRPKRVAEIRCGGHLQVLADAERAFENGHALLDRRQIENFGARVDRRLELHSGHGIDHQVDRFVAFRPRRVHVDIRREPHFRSQRDTAARNAGAVGLFNHELKMRSFDGVRDFFAQFRKELAITLFPESRSRYFASKNFSRMTPLVSMKKYPGRAMPLYWPTASVFRT